METNFVKVYIDLNKELCRTITIKSVVSADLINSQLINEHGESSVDFNDLLSWRYYLNISGEYHLHDEVMFITSLDTLETIEFTKANLDTHKTTKKAYSFGSRYYYSLLTKYPQQEQLILGILYPSDINNAIEAPDGTILSYPEGLVEEQEISLIASLQDFIYRYKVRWDVKSFNVSDDLYSLAQHGVMYLNILSKLLNLRLDRCKTNEAHSFHIKQYLASHNGLDIYLPYMTLKQSLFLYRNLLYIENNAGKTNQFKILIERLLTDRNIPISEYSVRHLNSFDSNYSPNITIRRKAINGEVNRVEQEFFDSEILFDKESTLSKPNELYLEHDQDYILDSFKNSTSSVIQTKDLESAMVDYTDAVPDPYRDVLTREWAYNSLTGRYIAVVTIKDPRTLEPILLSVRDCFIYSYYLALKSIGVNVVDLPVFVSFKHRRVSLPTVTEMENLVDMDLSDIINLILNNQPDNLIMSSRVSFEEYATNVFDEAYKHWFLESSIHDLYERINVEKLTNNIYEVTAVELPPETNDMASWLSDKGLPDYDLTSEETNEFLESIFESATGFSIDKTNKLANIQRSMVDILTALKSYTTQTVVEINDSGLKVLNWTALRVGDLTYGSDSRVYVEENIQVMQTDLSINETRELELIDSKAVIANEQIAISQMDVDTNITVTSNIIDGFNASVYGTINILGVEYPEFDEAISSEEIFIGFETYHNLTPEQQQSILTIYN